MWKAIDRRLVAQPRISHTLLEVFETYTSCILAFATIYSLALLPREDLQLALLPNINNPGLGFRILDSIYVITFIAAGIGFPHPNEQQLPTEARVVAWTTAFIMPALIVKLIIVTALSVRLNA